MNDQQLQELFRDYLPILQERIGEKAQEVFNNQTIGIHNTLSTNACFNRHCDLIDSHGNKTKHFSTEFGTRCNVSCQSAILDHEIGVVLNNSEDLQFPKFVDVEIPNHGFFRVVYNNGTDSDPDFVIDLDLKKNLSRNLNVFRKNLGDLSNSNGLGIPLITQHLRDWFFYR